MSLDPSDWITPYVALSGSDGRGLTWTLDVGGTRPHVRIGLRVLRDGKFLTGASIGAVPTPPSLMSFGFGFGGNRDDQVHRVMFGVDASVDRVVVLTDQGTELTIALSDLDAEFGLRFGAVVLPSTEVPAEIRAEIDGSIVEEHSAVLRLRPVRHGPDGMIR